MWHTPKDLLQTRERGISLWLLYPVCIDKGMPVISCLFQNHIGLVLLRLQSYVRYLTRICTVIFCYHAYFWSQRQTEKIKSLPSLPEAPKAGTKERQKDKKGERRYYLNALMMHVKHCCWNDKVEKKKKGEIILFTVTCNLRGIKSSKVSVLTRLYKHTHTLMHTQDCMKHPLCTVTKMAKILL